MDILKQYASDPRGYAPPSVHTGSEPDNSRHHQTRAPWFGIRPFTGRVSVGKTMRKLGLCSEKFGVQGYRRGQLGSSEHCSAPEDGGEKIF